MPASTRHVLVSLVGFFWLAAGCSSPKKIDLGGGCLLNSDCNSPLSCSFGKCHAACAATRDCPLGQACVKTSEGSVCQLPVDSDCQATLGLCPATDQVCAPDQRCRAVCQTPADCLLEQLCASGACADTTDVDPTGQITDAGVGTACVTSADCHSTLSCVMNRCHYICDGTNVCPVGQSCVRTVGGSVCQLPVEAGCDATTPCPGGLTCAPDYRCRSSCASPGDCTTGQKCVDGVCADSSDLNPSGQLTPKNPPKWDGGAGGQAFDAGSDGRWGDDAGAGGAIDVGNPGSTGGNGGSRNDGAAGEAGTGGIPSTGGSGGTRDGGTVDAHADQPADGGSARDVPLGPDGPSGTVETGGSVPGGPWTVVFEETFEGGIGLWYADNGVWQVGTPTVGPSSCYEGQLCAGTVLDGNYPTYTDSRLISPSITLPTLGAGEELQLRFWSWFSYASSCSGQVQVSVWDAQTSAWSTWTAVGATVNSSSAGWSPKGIDLTSYAGQRIRIAFFHNSDYYASTGWYVDGVQVIQYTPGLTGDFESGWGSWYAENGVWEVGSPTAGPASCHQGQACVGTAMNGRYPTYTDSRLVSPTFVLPVLAVGEELQLRFWNWFSFGSSSSGQVQVSTFDGAKNAWSAWASIGGAVNTSSFVWSPKAVDLTPYAGQSVRIAFLHNSDYYDGLGWYIDDVQLVEFTPDLAAGDFESGWGQWFADNGVWEVGTPSTGPGACYQGTSCAGTVLGGNYPTYTDSRLVSPSVMLPEVAAGEELQLRFWNWFSFGSSSNGQVQVSTWDAEQNTWSDWTAVGEVVSGNSPTWSLKAVSLTAQAGKLARIAFRHNSDYYDGVGWFIDSLSLVRL